MNIMFFFIFSGLVAINVPEKSPELQVQQQLTVDQIMDGIVQRIRACNQIKNPELRQRCLDQIQTKESK